MSSNLWRILAQVRKEGYPGPYFVTNGVFRKDGCTCALDGLDITLIGRMTVLGVYLGQDGGAAIVADSCASNTKGTECIRQDALKSIRLNNRWSLGAAGDNYGTNLVSAALFGNRIICDTPFEGIEQLGLERKDLANDLAPRKLASVLRDCAYDLQAISPGSHFFLVGTDDLGIGAWHWPSTEHGWDKPDVYRVSGVQDKLILVSPERLAVIGIGVPIEVAMARFLDYYAERFPGLVNRDLVMRRLSTGFALERPGKLSPPDQS